MGKMNFTKRNIAALPTPPSGRAQYLDEQVRGLGLLIQATGHRSFYWYKKVRNYPHWQTIGVFPDLTVEDARRRAMELNAKLARWKAAGYEGANPFERAGSSGTLDSLVDEYIARHLKEHAKNPERAQASLRWEIDKYLPSWRARPLTAIRPDDVARFHRTCGAEHGHRTANKVVKQLRTLFNFARREKLHHGENPAAGIAFYAETARTRFLKPDELARLWQALRTASKSNPDLADFVNLSLFTGARKSDVLSMRWSDVMLDDNRWTIPYPKSGVSYVVPLTPEAVGILKERARRRVDGSPYVFPSHGASGHVVDLKRGWKDLLIAADLYHPDSPELRVTQHDLRRTQGSWQAAQGASLLVIGKSLGHSSLDATKIYSRLDLGPVHASMSAANAAMSAAMKKKPKLLKVSKEPKQATAARHG